MNLTELATFSVVHRDLPWPWIAFAANGKHFAALSGSSSVASWSLVDNAITPSVSFALPEGLDLESKEETRLRGFAIDSSGTLLAAYGPRAIVTLDANGAVARTTFEALEAQGLVPRAIAFDRSGTRIWISADSEDGKESALLLLDARTHASSGISRSAPFPQPAVHELFVHPADSAVLVVAACGPDGTFARVAGFTDGPIARIETALDQGAVAAGFVGFSNDGTHAFFAEADEARTHAWPGLQQLSSVPLADEFISSYAGAVRGDAIFIDGEDVDTGDDAVIQLDRSGLLCTRLHPPFPVGMWAGNLGSDCIVTVDAKSEPAAARVIRLPSTAPSRILH